MVEGFILRNEPLCRFYGGESHCPLVTKWLIFRHGTYFVRLLCEKQKQITNKKQK